MEGYGLVTVESCLIAEVVYYPEKADAIRMAELLWPEINHEIGDLKVFDLKERWCGHRRRIDDGNVLLSRRRPLG
jgi:hypothetical protein